MDGGDLIYGWVGLDGVYRCQRHTVDPVGCVAVFRPTRQCSECRNGKGARRCLIPLPDAGLRATRYEVRGETLWALTAEEATGATWVPVAPVRELLAAIDQGQRRQGPMDDSQAVHSRMKAEEELPRHGVTVRAHVSHSLEQAETALEFVALQLQRKPRLSKDARMQLSRQLAGVIAECESVRLWLDAGCPEG